MSLVAGHLFSASNLVTPFGVVKPLPLDLQVGLVAPANISTIQKVGEQFGVPGFHWRSLICPHYVLKIICLKVQSLIADDRRHD